MADSQKPRLQHNFEPVWIEDFQILQQIGVRPWVLCLFLRLKASPEDLSVKISELAIQRELGWEPRNIRRYFRTLIEYGFIVKTGYLSYFVRPWRRLSTDSVKTTDLRNIPPRSKRPTTSVEMTDPPRSKRPTTSVEMTDPLLTEAELQKQSTAKPVLNNIPDPLKTIGKEFHR